MLSLDNAYSEEELREWETPSTRTERRTDVEYVCELKLDGCRCGPLRRRFPCSGITRGTLQPVKT